MEDWQKVQIKSNLSSLMNYTLVNPVFLAILVEEDVLSDIEVAQIMAKETNYDQAQHLYNILLTKSDGYYTLIKALTMTNQSGAYRLLFHPSEKISNLKVHFQGRTDQLNNLLNAEQITSIQTWLRQNAFTKEDVKALENDLRHETGVKLLRDTIPKKKDGYKSRFLTRRLQVSAELFKETCSELSEHFVFTGIEQSQLRIFVPPDFAIESSRDQLLSGQITARFILLESESHWEKICRKAKVPVHLLRNYKDTFVLEKSSGIPSLLRYYLEDSRHSERMSEYAFVKTVLSEEVKGVCICDTPGMGKSDLLANLARKISICCPESIVAFIQLRDFVVEENCANLQLKILEQVARTPMASQILFQLLQNKNTKFELFFDGLDEVQEKNWKNITTFLYQVGKSMPNARRFVTSRPVVCNELEKTVGVMAYDILPLDVETQRNIITEYWIAENNSSDFGKLTECADFCLEKLESNLNENERKITGAPLLCRLIAQVYSDKAAVYAEKNCNNPAKLTSNFASSLSEIYSKFIVRQLGESKCKYACLYKGRKVCGMSCLVRNFHVQEALAIVCPYLTKDLILYFNMEYAGLDFASCLSPGLLKINPFSNLVEFVHRTYAEYLVAEYFSKSLFMSVETFQCTSITQQKLVLLQSLSYREIFAFYTDLSLEERNEKRHQLGQYVVAYFFNSILTESEQLAMAAFIPTKTLFYITVEGCLKHNFEALLDTILGKGTDNNLVQNELSFLTLHGVLDFPCKVLKIFAQGLAAPGGVLAEFVDLYVFCKRRIIVSRPVYTLIRIAAENCSGRVVKKVCKFFETLFGRYSLKICLKSIDSPTLLQIAVKRADYEMVECFLQYIPPQNQGLLYFCLEHTYYEDNKLVDKRLDTAWLLLSKNRNLLKETWRENGSGKECKSPLLAENLHPKAKKFLLQQGEDVNASKANGLTVLCKAGIYHFIEAFVEFCQFLYLESGVMLSYLCIHIVFLYLPLILYYKYEPFYSLIVDWCGKVVKNAW